MSTCWFARLLLQRGLAAIYALGFLSALRQFRPLLGENGLLPIPAFLKTRNFRQSPSCFHWHYSDSFYAAIATSGLVLALLALAGWLQAGPSWLTAMLWLLLWFGYQSIVNVGQSFYGFGWESMLLEAGFFAAFLGSPAEQPSWVPVLLLRWMLFRVELGAGLIKLRHDRCWRDLTCLYYHYETQPAPNPLSWYFHRLPRWVHRGGVLGSHLTQLVVPFLLFAPQPVASLAGLVIIAHQLWLIVSGNYAWLNWLTAVLGFSALDDHFLGLQAPLCSPRPFLFDLLLAALGSSAVYLSIAPVRNLCSKNQAMNRSYNAWHLVNTYGAFGSVTRVRHEIVFEGTEEIYAGDATVWREYEFHGKPGDPRRRPPQVAPYHLRLDWLIWFLPLRLGSNLSSDTPHRRLAYQYESWFGAFVVRLLRGDRDTLALLRHNPFPTQPPMLVRALVFRYRYTTPAERRQTGCWWKRDQVGVYLPPYGLPTL